MMKNRWLYMVIGLLVVLTIGSLTMLSIALRHPPVLTPRVDAWR